MLKYLILDLGVILLTSLAIALSKVGFKNLLTKQVALSFLLLLVFTIVFDNLMIRLHFFGYNHNTIYGLFIYRAPIEDLAYPIVSLLLVVWLWRIFDDE